MVDLPRRGARRGSRSILLIAWIGGCGGADGSAGLYTWWCRRGGVGLGGDEAW